MKIPAPVRRGGHTHGVLWSPSLQRLTNDSPRRNDWLSSETLAPIESTTKNAHPMQQMEKSPTYYFSIPFFGKISKGHFFFVRNPACLRLLTISSISVPAGQSRHACRALKQIWQACYMHSTNGTDQLTCFKLKSPLAMLPLEELSNLSPALLCCDFHPHRTKKRNDTKQSRTPKCGGKNVRVHYGYPEHILTTGL